MIHRGGMGALCGYVGLPKSHALHGRDCNDISDIDVHGGLTYANECQGAICHIPTVGEDESLWWLGFDCAHCYDVSPGAARFGTSPEDRYRSIAYVRHQTQQLAEALANYTATAP